MLGKTYTKIVLARNSGTAGRKVEREKRRRRVVGVGKLGPSAYKKMAYFKVTYSLREKKK